LPSIIRLLVDARLEINSCLKEEVSLDQVFRAVVSRRPEPVRA